MPMWLKKLSTNQKIHNSPFTIHNSLFNPQKKNLINFYKILDNTTCFCLYLVKK
jgi:hypothetical protein